MIFWVSDVLVQRGCWRAVSPACLSRGWGWQWLDLSLLDVAQYVREGVGELDSAKLPDLLELKYLTVSDGAAQLGGVKAVRAAFSGFQKFLYQAGQ